MDNFKAALTTWMDVEARITIRGLANLSGLDPSEISRLRGPTPKHPTGAVLSKLLLAVRTHYSVATAKSLLTSYLLDEIPECMAGTVTVSDATQHTPSDPLNRALAFFLTKAQTDADFAAWLIQLHEMLSPTPAEELPDNITPMPTQPPAGGIKYVVKAVPPANCAEAPSA